MKRSHTYLTAMVILLSAAAATGCLRHGVQFAVRTTSEVQAGMTKEEVRKIMGSPQRIDHRKEDTEAWTYAYAKSYLILTKGQQYTVVFVNGKVTDTAIGKATSGKSAQW